MTQKVSDRYAAYKCGDYFQSTWSQDGYFDNVSHTVVIAPSSEAYELEKFGFFAVGRDGVNFGYRKNHFGLWAFDPIVNNFKFMAETV